MSSVEVWESIHIGSIGANSVLVSTKKVLQNFAFDSVEWVVLTTQSRKQLTD